MSQVQIKDLYPLSPMQEGMLFHSILDEKSDAYFQQSIISLGEELEVSLLQQSLQQLIDRYDILRTVFTYKETDRPLQIVLEKRQADPVYVEDVRGLSPEAKQQRMEYLLKTERDRGFDLEQDIPLRLALIHWDHQRSKLLWISHHISMDGWCVKTIADEFLQIYTALRDSTPLSLGPVEPYSRFIQWLEHQNRDHALEYWRQYLSQLEHETTIPGYSRPSIAAAHYNSADWVCTWDADLVEGIERLARQYRVTPSTVFHSIWAVLLHKYNNSDDVVMGTVVSGRPHDIAGIEEMIGLFINTIPIRVTASMQDRFSEILTSIQHSSIESDRYSFLSLSDIQAGTELKQNLIQHLIAFENVPQEGAADSFLSSGAIQLEGIQDIHRTNYDLNIIVMPGRTFEIRFSYNQQAYEEEMIRQLATHLTRVLKQVIDTPDILLFQIDILSEDDKQLLLFDLNRTATDYPSELTVYQCFEAQALRTPEAVALRSDSKVMTYQELNEEANRLAHFLINKKMGPGQIVGIAAEHSCELIIAILAVLKSGAAYLPIDPQYPAERIQYMLNDSKARMVLAHKELLHRMDFKGECFDLQDPSIYLEDCSNPDLDCSSDQLAYVIYTSGSTGQPKGVMVVHRGLTNYIWWASASYLTGEREVFACYSSISFDLTVTSIFAPLISGHSIRLYRDDQAEFVLFRILRDQMTTVVKLTPAHLTLLTDAGIVNSSVRTFIVGGEDLKVSLCRSIHELWQGDIAIFNEYGPTETVVGCMIHRFDYDRDTKSSVPIGVPADNVAIYLLDAALRPVPFHVEGEIYIGGDGVARGYLYKEELSREKFIPNPFIPGTFMYRTGDLARRRPDGTLVYGGRADFQVKIKGYRIEPGEIENLLLQLEAVTEAYVMVHTSTQGQKTLCAYLAADQSLTSNAVKDYLHPLLPSYMVPSHIVVLDTLPLTVNGKVDRSALPAPGISTDKTSYVAPRTEEEALLAVIWQSVLGRESVGVYDDFFELGGDSIKAIQVSARLYQEGYKLNMRDLFKHGNVAALAAHLKKETDPSAVNQEENEGTVTLTPYQIRAIVEREASASHHHSDILYWFRQQGFDETALRAALHQLLARHDSLRMNIHRTSTGYEVSLHDSWMDKLIPLQLRDEYGRFDAGTEFNRLSLPPTTEESPLQMELLHQPGGDLLTIAVHPALLDVWSWSVVQEDLSIAYEQASKKEAVSIPDKTLSFQAWSIVWNNHISEAEFMAAKDYWSRFEREYALAPVAQIQPDGLLPKTERDSTVSSITTSLTLEDTTLLLRDAHHAYNTTPQELLVTALANTLKDWTHHERIGVYLEIDRRDTLSGADISRTVGCLTASYPVLFQLREDSELSDHLKHIKEHLRHVPAYGVGWSYAQITDDIQISFSYTASPQVVLEEGMHLELSGPRQGSVRVRAHATGDSVTLMIQYHPADYQQATMQRFMDDWLQHIRAVLKHCAGIAEPQLTPTDVLLKPITQEQLDTLVSRAQSVGNMENVYPLSPMQKGMFFHNLMNREQGMYFDQVAFDLQGEFDPQYFRQSLQLLIRRHAIFRTNFYTGWHDQPLQVVYRDKQAEFSYRDVVGQDTIVSDYMRQDRYRGFDLGKDVLLRVAVFRMGNQSYRCVWSYHHILMDGWCMSLVTDEVFTTYFALLNGQQLQESTVTPYSDYIHWLERQDKESARRYWNDYLTSLEQQTLLPGVQSPQIAWQNTREMESQSLSGPKNEATKPMSTYIIANHTVELGSDLTGQLRQLAQQQRVTLNSVLQSVWGILLQKYNHSRDVVFGSVVSGRPPELEGVENIVGLFINTIPVRITSDAELRFIELLQRLQQQAVLSAEYDTYPLHEIQSLTEQKQALIQHIMVFENVPVTQRLGLLSYSGLSGEEGISISNVEATMQTNYDLNIIVEPGDSLQITMEYNACVYPAEAVERLQQQFLYLLTQVVKRPNSLVDELTLATPAEQETIVNQWNATTVEYPKDKSIRELFEQAAVLYADQIAVRMGSKVLTYRELNERSNALARTLQDKGVCKEQAVGILSVRSLEMIVGVLAIVKAGGMYVPIDPDYPVDRKIYILEDSGAQLLLVHGEEHLDDEYGNCDLLDLLSAHSYSDSVDNVEMEHEHPGAAYVIYTSGSTGKPKGVVVEQHNVLRLVMNTNYVHLDNTVRILQTGSLVFDASTFEIWGALLHGGQLILTEREVLLDVAALKELIRSSGTTTLFITTALFNQLVQQDAMLFSELRELYVGGEIMSLPHVNKVLHSCPSLSLSNIYGPTENTTFTTSYLLVGEQTEAVPIGRPISNTTTYVVDEGMNLLPVGAWGELVIGGDGVAREYLNRPELTDLHFIPNPFIAGTRLYRTGDLVRWREDGVLEYQGRKDEQVKVRGHRIEPGEIASYMRRIESLHEVVVVTCEDSEGQKALCAYFTSNREWQLGELRALLLKELPSYMVPSYFVKVSHIPLTINGKVDRKMLPEPQAASRQDRTYVAPTTTEQKLLASIWEGVLGTTPVGLQDNFFDLGGDSIKAIQVASRLQQGGYKLELKDLFKQPTIEQLGSLLIKATESTAEQGEVEGQAPLTPIQHWFIRQGDEVATHFNQAVLLHRQSGFEQAALRKALLKLVQHHDALRMVLRNGETGYELWNRGWKQEYDIHLEILDWRDHTEVTELQRGVEDKSNTTQSSLDLENGPLMKAVLFRCPDGDHLLIVIHHLVVDGVSWRIILEDLNMAYEQALQGMELSLPDKTDSFQLWSQHLTAYANASNRDKDDAYWERLNQRALTVSADDSTFAESSDITFGDSKVVKLRLSCAETELLLKQANRTFYTEVNDLLLTGLGLALADWTGKEENLINMEGHGREDILPGLNITRTIGWFTSQYPVLLKVDNEDDLGTCIRKVKEDLRGIPQKGIGYGIWRYLKSTVNGESQGERDACPVFAEPKLSFNYLGQFDQDVQGSEVQISEYSYGQDIGDQFPLPYDLDLVGIVTEGALEIDIRYNTRLYSELSAQQFCITLKGYLSQILEYCTTSKQRVLSPSDLLLKGLTIEQLDRLVERTRGIGEIEDVFPLVPMQQGMLYHSLLHPDDASYFEQARFDLEGDFEQAYFEESLQLLARRHAVFRTNFMDDWCGQPVQIVFSDKKIGFSYEDIREHHDQIDRLTLFAAADKTAGFDLGKDSLMRVAVFRTGERRFHLVWSFHHILMDGWCLALVSQEVFSAYDAMRHGEQPASPPVSPYRNYIEWLQQQDKHEARQYWQSYLAEYEHRAAPLGMSRLVNSDPKAQAQPEYVLANHTFMLNRELVAGLEQLSKEQQVTMNTLLQSIWGVMLQRYNHCYDVVFGSVVSGRPPEVNAVENMIGLFINTIPVRVQCEPDTSFRELLRNVQEQGLSSTGYGSFPLFEIQALTKQRQDLINHILVFENYPVSEQLEQLGTGSNEDGEQSYRIFNMDFTEQTNYDFNLICVPGEQLEIIMKYNAFSFSREMVERMAGHLIQMMEQIVNDPYAVVGSLQLLTQQEVELIVQHWNQTADVPVGDQSVSRRFEEQALLTPDQVAVRHGEQALTYYELDQWANQLAWTLREQGVDNEQAVGIFAQRSLEMIVGVLAIVKAGGLYVPLDPDYPEERILYMLEDSGAMLLLAPQEHNKAIPFQGRTLNLQDPLVYSSNRQAPEISGAGQNGLYIIYTSGSTGKPKGVLVEHRNVLNLVTDTQYVQLDESTCILQTGSLVFDASTFEVWGTLLNGGQLVMADAEDLLDASRLGKILGDNGVNTMFMTTALFNQMVQQDVSLFTGLRELMVGGEVMSVTHVNRAIQASSELRISNIYGPTENTTFSTMYTLQGQQFGNVPIGRPIQHSTAYVVNESLQLQPIGAWGELLVGGSRVARGYVNRPELTAKQFISSPFRAGERLYRTGDLVRWRDDGVLEYQGRMDQQVKIRGYRVEPGEIEYRIAKYNGVKGVFVRVLSDPSGFSLLCAYIATNELISTRELRDYLGGHLPSYLIPDRFLFIEKLPLTVNGKIDTKSLPLPENIDVSGAGYAEPRTPLEHQLADIWTTVLNVQRVGIDDSFFDLGGHSLKAIQLIAAMKEAGISTEIHHLLQQQTIRRLGATRSLSNEEELGGASDLLNHSTFRFTSAAEDSSNETELESFDHEKALQEKSNELLRELIEMCGQWSDQLYDAYTIGYYELAPIQEYHAMHPMVSGMTMIMEDALQLEHLNAAIRQLISNHELLRSCLTKEQEEWKWELKESPSQLSVPLLDLSSYSSSSQHKLLARVLPSLYSARHATGTGLQYSFVLVRMSTYRHMLVFLCSHTIFDGTSSGILRSQLLDAYVQLIRSEANLSSEDIQELDNHKSYSWSYPDYVQHVRQGPLDMPDIELVDNFRLREFADNHVRKNMPDRAILGSSGSSYHWEFDCLPNKEEKISPLDVSLQLAYAFFSDYFGLKQVPLWLTHFGRQYGSYSYFGTFGECIDHIPLLLVEESPDQRVQHLQGMLDTVIHHHVNFFNLIMNEEMVAIYPESSSLLKMGLKQLPIVFNYLGDITEEVELGEYLHDLVVLDGKESAADVIYFEVRSSDNRLHIDLTLPYTEPKVDLTDMFEKHKEKVLSLWMANKKEMNM
ncbi:non-ribosomal peptide synthetase [Paenibacillus massiliensis]|uniref:non-ribosomal peptide synthetase n=1 Tax=Paenibacillus massiliensis TaxID=225917 RepID=UPI00039C27AF|nr:non-ribosomal peptide synthetase [Paenibacillus massiliensis]